MNKINQKQLTIWLISALFLILLIVIIGGATRLTHSGLSMVEWHPISGIIPPLSETDWINEFENYKRYPEYLKINYGMSLSQFKFIYFWEYIHRLAGRLLGILFIIPFFWFLLNKKLNYNLIIKLLIMFILGAFQGLYGWYMVKSGLIDDPYVSHYRLAGHLLLAFTLVAYILWNTLELNKFYFQTGSQRTKERLKPILQWIFLVIIIQVAYGAFTAGLKAGFGWNTFPKMGGQWIPGGLLPLSPWYVNFFEHSLTVQFIHRMLGWLLCILIPGFWKYAHEFELNQKQKQSINLLLYCTIVQFILGMLTIIWVVPIWLGVSHQIGALCLLAIWIYCYFLVCYTK
tara:strand:+ start:1458 stop:2489 length:1032 start_codon:yes stop_codon:yes gene_type:complete